MINRDKLIKGALTILGIILLVWGLSLLSKSNSKTLSDYAAENPEIAYLKKPSPSPSPEAAVSASPAPSDPNDPQAAQTPAQTAQTPTQTAQTPEAPTSLIGASLNKDTLAAQRVTYQESFYYEPLSDNLCRFITGISFPQTEEGVDPDKLEISYDELAYLHILHYDFEGSIAEGELICNRAIAQDLAEIFYELYLNEYQLERVRLIDEYDGDDLLSMEDNNTSCFNYRVVEGSTSLSKHAFGLAIDINPLYNPYITYEKDGTEQVAPASALAYADRALGFPYKIDESDLCYKLFKEHGFTWGGNWNSCKDYQHFQKTID